MYYYDVRDRDWLDHSHFVVKLLEIYDVSGVSGSITKALSSLSVV